MKTIIIIAVLVTLISGTIVNTTDFFNTAVGYNTRIQSFTGYQDIDWYFDKDTAAMYYSFWQGVGDDFKDNSVPIIIWLQGGPGESSQFGAFNEIGPLHIQGSDNFTVMENPWKWNIRGHLLFIDSPLGVGFSYNKNKVVSTTLDTAHHLANFLSNFMDQWNFKGNPIYLAGESFAGHYIPVLARTLLTNSTLKINLRGVMIGNGKVDPARQINYFDSFLYNVGIISNSGRDTVSSMQNEAILSILDYNYTRGTDYTNWVIANQQVVDKFFGGINLYNYRLFDHNNVNANYVTYLNNNKKVFGVPDNITFSNFNKAIYTAFSADISMSVIDQLEYILGKGLKVLIYNGQNDVIVNTPGVLTYLNSLKWSQARQWRNTPKQQWNFAGKNLGWVKRYSNLAFVMVKEAGQLVAADQPRSAQTIMQNFINGIW